MKSTDNVNYLIDKTEEDLTLSPGPHNFAVEQQLMPEETRNGYFNHFGCFLDYKTGRGKSVPAGKNKGPCMIIGSGQSLDHAAPLLKKFKGAIFCSSSHGSTLVYHGRPPDFIFLLDIRCDMNEMPVKGGWGQYKQTQLILHPGVQSQWVSMPVIDEHGGISLKSAWPDRKLYYRPMEPSRKFYRETLPDAYPWITTFLLLFACHTSDCIGMAKLMGYDPIILVGNDFGIVKNRERFRKWEYSKKHPASKKETWWRDKPRTVARYLKRDMLDKVLKADNGGITTDVSLYYKKTTMMVYRLDQANILNTSTGGILWEYPGLSIEEAIERQDTGYKDLYVTDKEKRDMTDRYLIRRRCFPMSLAGGLRFVEAAWFTPWEVIMKQYMTNFNNFVESAKGKSKIVGAKAKPKLNIKKHMDYFRAIIAEVGIMGEGDKMSPKDKEAEAAAYKREMRPPGVRDPGKPQED